MKKKPLMFALTLLSAFVIAFALAACGGGPPPHVELDRFAYSMYVGDAFTLHATIYPEGTKGTVVWASSDTSIVTVDRYGYVTAISEGFADVTATIGDSSATCGVTVNSRSQQPVISLKDSLSLEIGGRYKLTVTGAEGKDVKWSSSAPEVAAVDDYGNVMAIAEGKATITVIVGDKRAYCEVTVGNKQEPPPAVKDPEFKFTENPDGNSYTLDGYDNYSVWVKALVIPSEYNGKPVTAIKQNAFFWDSEITSLTIPSSIKTIGEQAFGNCENLESVEFADGLETIGVGAFRQCKKLENVSLPNSLKTIDENAFGVSGLVEIDVPDGVKTIGNQAFGSCGKLESAKIPASVTEFGYYVFHYCPELVSVEIGGGFEEISARMFEGCVKLSDVTLCEGLTSIGYHAFDNCGALERIVLPDGFRRIEVSAFVSCGSLSEIAVPDTIAYISNQAFINCGELKYNEKNGVKYLGNATNKYVAACGATDPDTTELTFDENTKFISNYAFASVPLGSVTIPNGVKVIGEKAFAECPITALDLGSGVSVIDSGAFTDCDSLTTVTIPASVAKIGDYAFGNCNLLESVVWNAREVERIYPADAAGRSSIFANSTNLTSFTVGESVRSIPDGLLDGCGSLTTLDIREGVQKIDGIKGLSKLATLSLPSTLTELGDIEKLPLLAELTLPASLTQIGDIKDCAKLVSVDAPETLDVTHVTFDNCPLIKGFVVGDFCILGGKLTGVKEGVTTVIVPDSVTTIAAELFKNVTTIEYIYIPDTVTEAETDAFVGCTATVFVGGSTSGVTSATATVYRNVGKCTADGWIYNGSSVRAYIGEGGEIVVPARLGDTDIDTIGYNANNPNVPKNVLLGRSDITKLTIEASGEVSVNADAFKNCSGLNEIVFGENVTRVNISKAAFDGCAALGEISLAGGYGDYVFVSSANPTEKLQITSGADLLSKIQAAGEEACVIMKDNL